jgi:hypothetical protein
MHVSASNWNETKTALFFNASPPKNHNWLSSNETDIGILSWTYSHFFVITANLKYHLDHEFREKYSKN